MATSTLCLLVRAASRTALLRGQLASLGLLVSVGMRFGELGAGLNRLGSLAQDHRDVTCDSPCLTCCALTGAIERGGLALDRCRVSASSRHLTILRRVKPAPSLAYPLLSSSPTPIRKAFALIHELLPVVGDPLTLICNPLALIRDPLALIRDPLALIRELLTLVG